MRLAALPWYDLHEVHDVHDRLWSRIANVLREGEGFGVPSTLSRGGDHRLHWSDPELLLGQACGYDVALGEVDLQVVATPHFEVPGCDGPRYRSYVVVRTDDPARTLPDLAGRRCVINSTTSQSGMGALRSLIAPLARGGRFFSEVQVSGAHERSVAAVAGGRADVACIDCITWELLRRHRPAALEPLRVLAPTADALAPPFVTGRRTDARTLAALRHALAAALPEPGLLLTGISVLRASADDPIAAAAHQAQRAGYDELARPQS